MKIAILSRQPDLYGNHRLLAAAAARHWHAVIIDPLHGQSGDGAGSRVQPGIPDPYDGIEAVIPRYGPYWQRQAHAVLKQLQLKGIRSLNDADAIALARDTPACLQTFTDFGLPSPNSVSIDLPDLQADCLSRLPFAFPVVLKHRYSSQGLGVELYREPASLAQRAQDLLDQHRPFLLQEFIAEAEGRDLRLLVVGGKVIAAMQRSAAPGEFRANVHLGGVAEAVQATVGECRLALAAAAAIGLQVAGVDIIRSSRGPLLLEINACPGFEALERVSGVDVAGKLLDLLGSAQSA